MSGERLANLTTELPVNPEVVKYLEECLALGEEFENPPEVVLELITRVPPEVREEVGPRGMAITAGYQCYAPGKPKMKTRLDEDAQNMAESTLRAGHHTTRMHYQMTWRITATRSVIHDFLHSHEYYNTSQQSQRYVEAKVGSYLIPASLSPEQREIYLQAANFANNSYFRLLEALEPEIRQRVNNMYPKEAWIMPKMADALEKKIKKLCQEVARYALPIGQNAIFLYTLNQVQLQRFFRVSRMPWMSTEAKYITASMILEIAKVHPEILQELEVPLEPQGKIDYNHESIANQKREFDESLNGRVSRLELFPEGVVRHLAEVVRNVLGKPESELSDEEALRLLLDPAENQLLADVYETGMLDQMTRALRQVSVSFKTRLSHTADSQRQRQRRTPGATPPIEATYDGRPDYIVPMVIRENGELSKLYHGIIQTIYQNVEAALEAGMPKEYALLLLPNAHTIRVKESGDLLDWLHRFKQRLCLLAQEEIFFVSIDQVLQLTELFPEAALAFQAPCGVRQTAGIRPRCPEGKRWCGQPIFCCDVEDYIAGRLV